jgi:hypothetical protein
MGHREQISWNEGGDIKRRVKMIWRHLVHALSAGGNGGPAIYRAITVEVLPILCTIDQPVRAATALTNDLLATPCRTQADMSPPTAGLKAIYCNGY